MSVSSASPPPAASRPPFDRLPNIVSIPPGAPFLPTLVSALLDGRLIADFQHVGDPLALARVTIWVPTRRAARALADEFVSRLAGKPAILPRIRVLGDAVDEDPMEVVALPEGALEPLIDPLKRQLILSRLINSWSNNLKARQRQLYAEAEIVVPSSMSDAVWFAAELGRLMDSVTTEEVSWTKLEGLVPDEYASWWQLTLEFLQIATSKWPGILSATGLRESAAVRVLALRRQADIYHREGSVGPVIAAGSTGSIPATAALLKSIAQMQNGVVVLPGLDRDLDNETWQKVDLPDNEKNDSGTAPGHPQYGLKLLLDQMGTSRSGQDIAHLDGVLGHPSGFMRLREKLVSEALRPPHSTGKWREFPGRIESRRIGEALLGVTVIEAANEREEALAIALALRETLEQDQETAALVTPDRNLARRVATEMQRFGVMVDDSAGHPLSNTLQGRFLRLVSNIGYGEATRLALASLIKHPFCRLGGSRARISQAAELFEIAILRGSTNLPKAGSLAPLAKQQRDTTSPRGLHPIVKRLSADDWSKIVWLAEKLDAFLTLCEAAGPSAPPAHSSQTLGQLVSNTIALIEECAADENRQFDDFYGSEDGQVLAGFLSSLLDNGDLLECEPAQWPDILEALMAHSVTRSTGNAHSRVAILGPLEARLQSFDRVVLGGLNEKSWPASTRNDAFLSRPMRSALGLPPPERRTGLAAHDFQMLMGMQDVVLTRSQRSEGAPTVASRWIQRLRIVIDKQNRQEMMARGQVYLDWARNIDGKDRPARSCRQPVPTPPLSVRPNSLAITDIETWIGDPYSIYARHILRLVPLDRLSRQADARERGILYHAIMEDFVRLRVDARQSDALHRLLVLARQRFDAAQLPAEIAATWWPRFKSIAAAFMQWHSSQIENAGETHVELSGQTDCGLDQFVLRGRADRIDRLHDGSLAIYDYKTGTSPTLGAVKSFRSPQLLLEAAMAKRGAFGTIFEADTARLGYIRLRPVTPLQVDLIGEAEREAGLASQLGEEAWCRLQQMIRAYRNPQKDYRSRARQLAQKNWEEDYDHLARVREWSVDDDQEDAE